MKIFLYQTGRTLQLLSLITLPAAIWIVEIERSEVGAIALFVSSILVFFIGYLLVRVTR